VGRGVVELLARNGAGISRRTGYDLRIVHVGMRTPRAGLDVGGAGISRDVLEVARNPEVDVLVELIGGETTARELALTAIAHRKHLVTANKALIAVHGREIFEAARKRGVVVACEAAVAGAIPIMKTIRESLAANRIFGITGIVNGTANYVLTAMQEERRDLAVVLEEAQRHGYAESDPAFDIDGTDAAHKLAILATAAFHIPLAFDRIRIRGIDAVTLRDIDHADALGFRIRHLAVARARADGHELAVHPALLPSDEFLAGVRGVMNAVLVHTDAAGKLLLCGPGAGGAPTASAVVADLLEIAKHTESPETSRPQWQLLHSQALPMSKGTPTRHYLRISLRKQAGSPERIADVLARAKIAVAARHTLDQERPASLALISEPALQADVERVQESLAALPEVIGQPLHLRVEDG